MTSVLFCLAYQTEDFVTGYRGYDELLIELTDHSQTQKTYKAAFEVNGLAATL